MKFLLKLILKIIAIPFVIALTLVNALIEFVLFLSGKFLALLSFLFGIGGVYALCSGGSTLNGVVALVMAFVVSPFGVPAIVGFLAGLLDGLNDCIKEFICS